MNHPYHFFAITEQIGNQVNQDRRKAIAREKYCKKCTMLEKGAKIFHYWIKRQYQSYVPNRKESAMQFLG